MLFISSFLFELFYCCLFNTDIKLFNLDEEGGFVESILLDISLYVDLGFVVEES